MALNGTDVLVLIDGTLVGSQQDSSFEDTTESIDTSSKDSRARTVIPGRYSSTVSLDALYVASDTAYIALQAAMRDGTTVTIKRQEEGSEVEQATAVITSLSAEAPDQDVATVSASFDISGEWTELGT